jgi:predicted transcriptional regulator
VNQDLAYSLRCQTKRTDLPTDVVRSLSEAYQALQDVADAVSEMETMLIEQRAEVKRLREMEQMDQLLIKELLGTSEQLLKERDEARRWVSQIGAKSKEEAEKMAIRRGWDCFKKEETT